MPSSPLPYVPGKHQIIGADYLVEHPRCMLVADPGLGKTTTVLLGLDHLTLLGSNFFPALVLAPKRVADVVWTGEVAKWARFNHFRIVQITGSEEQRREILKRPVYDIYVINYELVEWLVATWPQAQWPFKIVVADECSRLKGFRLQKGRVRAAALGDIARYTGRWWNLTGTPSPNGLQDLWGQMWFVDFGERLKLNYTAFKDAFLMEDPYTHRVKLQLGAAEMIHELVADRMIAFRAEDWLDITKPQIIPVPFVMGTEAQARYREMERDFFMEVDDKQIEAGNAMVKSTKLLQICSGSIYDADTNAHHIHDDRLAALDSVLEENGGEPVLLSYYWRTDPPRILAHLKKLGIAARVYGGKQDEDDWNARKFRVMLLQENCAYGLNLHEPCRDIFHYSYFWGAEMWTQMIGRVGPTRQAQAGKKCVVRVWIAQAAGTLESGVVDSNLQKISVEDALKRARAQRIQ